MVTNTATTAIGTPGSNNELRRFVNFDPLTDPRYERLLQASADATVFHSPGWIRVLRDSYDFHARGTAVVDSAGDFQAAVPLIPVPPQRRVALPFSDVCGLLALQEPAANLLLRELRRRADTTAGFVELRGSGLVDPAQAGFVPGTDFYLHSVPLEGSLAEIEDRYAPAAKRAIRKAEKDGVQVQRATGGQAMRFYYDFVKRTRKKQLLLPQPFRFYDSIRRHMFENGDGFLLLAFWDGVPIAGDLLLRFKDTLVYKFNASDERYLAVRPNNLLLANAIRLGHELGCKKLDLGRCDLDGDGLRRFKLLWGGNEDRLRYYFYPAKPPSKQGLEATVRQKVLPEVVKRSPTWLLAAAGDAYYKSFA